MERERAWSHLLFFSPTFARCVFSSVPVKSKTEQCQCAFKYHSSARKRQNECYNYVCVQFSVGLCQRLHTCVHIYIYMYVLVCVCVRQGVHICVTVSMCRLGVGVSCVLVCRRPWMLSRLQLGTVMVHVQCRKQQEQATYKLNGRHTLKTSTFTLASSSWAAGRWNRLSTHASCLAVNQNRKYKVFLGSSEYWLFQMNCYIYKIGLIPV